MRERLEYLKDESLHCAVKVEFVGFFGEFEYLGERFGNFVIDVINFFVGNSSVEFEDFDRETMV